MGTGTTLCTSRVRVQFGAHIVRRASLFVRTVEESVEVRARNVTERNVDTRGRSRDRDGERTANAADDSGDSYLSENECTLSASTNPFHLVAAAGRAPGCRGAAVRAPVVEAGGGELDFVSALRPVPGARPRWSYVTCGCFDFHKSAGFGLQRG